MPLNPPQDYRKTAYTHRRGIAASRPAAADVLPGTLYFSTDTGITERSTGTVWESYSGSSQGISNHADLLMMDVDEPPQPIEFFGNLPALSYVEGSITVALTFGGGSTGITYTSNAGKFIRVGRFVAVTGLLQLTSKGSSTGSAVISGLPYTIGPNFGNYSSAKVSYNAFTAGVQEVGLQSVVNTSTVIPVKSVAGTNTQMTDADFSNTSTLVLYFCYIIG